MKEIKKRTPVMLEFTDGKSEKGALLNAFRPERKEVDVIISSAIEVQKFLFSELNCISFIPDANHRKAFQDSHVIEEITTISGRRYEVAILDRTDTEAGFYGMTTGKDLPYRLIYFISRGVRIREQGRLIGDILQEKGSLTPDSLLQALADQKELKQKRVGDIISEDHKIPISSIEEALTKAQGDKKISVRIKVGDILVEAGLVTKEQVEQALASQTAGKRKRLGELLLERGLITEDELLKALASKFRMELIDLDNLLPNMKAIEALPLEVAKRLHVFPVVEKGDRLIVATSNPTDHTIEGDLQFYTGKRIEMVVAPSSQIKNAIEKFYGKDALPADLAIELIERPLAEEDIEEESAYSETDSQIITTVNNIFIDAYQRGASDIHFEPGYSGLVMQIRYRIDGALRVVHHIPASFKRAVVSRIKIMANLDIVEHRRPQSGKIVLKIQERMVEFRLEVTPTVGNNEAVVLRILSGSQPLQIEEMGFTPGNLVKFKRILSQPYGLILCVGPTGSGKTTTLHSALAQLNTPGRKIWTVEDPVEITQPGLSQVQVAHKIGLTFGNVLRSLLRADPDVIMVGEMRDGETARIAIEASLTGHLVLSTLHTNSAVETIIRLIEMGMDSLTFADVILGIMAQRLAKRLCNQCKAPYHPTREEYSELVQLYDPLLYKEDGMPDYSDNFTLMKKNGCEKCGGSGYQGRIALHELVVGTENLKKAIKNRAKVEDLRSIALQDGARILLMDGINKIIRRQTDLEQVLKVCYSQSGGDIK